MIKVGIVGATGYTGEEIIRLLVTRPDVELTCLTSRNSIGQKVQDYSTSGRVTKKSNI